MSGTQEPRLKHVFNGGPAERAGLAAGDVVVAVDGLRATASLLEQLATSRGAGETVSVHAFRRDELLTAAVVLEPAPLDTCWLEVDADADEPTRDRRLAWLGAESLPV
jgi:predicted metalloprotease with PDZ domain